MLERGARTLLAATGLALCIGWADSSRADGVKVETFDFQDPSLALGQVTFKGGKTLTLHQGIGSAAFHPANASPGTFVTLGDRGPNFTCEDAKDLTEVDGKSICGELKNGRIYPTPSYSPSIYRIEVAHGAITLKDVIPLKDAAGKPLSGMPNTLTMASTEQPVDATGKELAQDPGAVDAEGIVELADGTFWIGEENAPSILHVAKDGRVLKRLVPAGSEKDFAKAGYPVEGLLPAILTRRQANRGIESMAISPDGAFLYFVLQNPLANPDAAAFKQASNTRLFKIDAGTGKPVAEYVYELTPMSFFKGEEKKLASAARISELLAIDGHRFLIDDRTDKTTLIFEIDLAGATDILGGIFDDPATRPTLEQQALAKTGIEPVKKRLVLDSSKFPELPTKIEGMAFFGAKSGHKALMLINDDDFGIEGDHTKVARITGLPLGHQAK